jgi:hypothetical protein
MGETCALIGPFGLEIAINGECVTRSVGTQSYKRAAPLQIVFAHVSVFSQYNHLVLAHVAGVGVWARTLWAHLSPLRTGERPHTFPPCGQRMLVIVCRNWGPRTGGHTQDTGSECIIPSTNTHLLWTHLIILPGSYTLAVAVFALQINSSPA